MKSDDEPYFMMSPAQRFEDNPLEDKKSTASVEERDHNKIVPFILDSDLETNSIHGDP